jgi:hypothetical protein
VGRNLKSWRDAVGRIVARVLRPGHPSVIDEQRLRFEYFSYGTQHLAAGRFQVSAGMTPIAGVNLHHAIEMYLKGYLFRSHTSERQRRKLRHHRLRRIWKAAKRQANDPSLAQFDATIKTLDLFERVRYPEDLLRLGAEISVAMTSPKTPGRATGPDGKPLRVPLYEAYLDQVDALVAKLFKLASVNHAAQSVQREAKAVLNDANAAMTW